MIGLLALGDAPKAGAASAVKAPQRVSVRSALITGDNAGSAQALAQLVGIRDVHADVAMHTAGITLMRGDPALVADAIDISRRT